MAEGEMLKAEVYEPRSINTGTEVVEHEPHPREEYDPGNRRAPALHRMGGVAA